MTEMQQDDAERAAWNVVPHKLNYSLELTEDDARAPTPAGFRTELYPPQKTMLAAMVALERDPRLRIGPSAHGPEGELQLAVARTSAQLSFGKTVLMLALVQAQRLPAERPLIAPLVGAVVGAGVRPGCYYPEAVAVYESVLPVTFVAASANVISQWIENTERFTDLRALVIENVHGMRAFETLYRSGALARDYDLVFVKAGRIVSSFVVAGERAAGAAGRAEAAPPLKTRSMFEAIARVLEGVPVARLIIDDYDTLKLGGDDCFIPASFTWLVSATRRRTNADTESHTGGATPADYIRRNLRESTPILGAALDDVVNGCGSLRCAEQYVAEHINSTMCAFHRIVVPGGRAAGMLHDLLRDDVRDAVVEMVNADAVGAAAATLGLEATSVGDIVRRVVGAHLDKLRVAMRTLARVERARAGNYAAAAGAGTPPVGNPVAAAGNSVAAAGNSVGSAAGNSAGSAVGAAGSAVGAAGSAAGNAVAAAGSAAGKYDPSTVGSLRRSLRDGTDAEFHAVWSSPQVPSEAVLETLLDDCAAAAMETVAVYGKTLGRMRDNIREGCCQVCTLPFEKESGDAAYVLAGCCQIIICEHCVTRPVRSGGATVRQFIKRCPNCAVDVATAAGALIRVGAELDLEAALSDRAVVDREEAPAADPAAGAADAIAAAPPAELANAKLRALVQYIKREPVEALAQGPVGCFVPGLLEGRRTSQWPADKPRRTLVFTMHAESTRLIEFALGIAQVPYSVLRGTRAQKDAVLEAVRAGAGNRVLLVTAAKDCAGIHMPWLSDIVFYHRVADRHVEAQVAARGQRLGREHDLVVTVLVNEAENQGLD